MAPHARQSAVRLKRIGDAVLGSIILWLLRALRRINPDSVARFTAGFLRIVGPWLPEHRIGRAQLAAAFPEKSAAEIEQILLGVWDKLGRVVGWFPSLDRLWDYDRRHPKCWPRPLLSRG